MAKIEPISLQQEFTFTATTTFDNLRVYEEVLRTHKPLSFKLTFVRAVPTYTGRVPRFALWGARGRVIQVGSKEDAAWYRRVRRGTSGMSVTLPNVKWNNEA